MLPEKGLFSVGLHPWHITDLTYNITHELEKLTKLLQSSRVLMIGECGLDRLSETIIAHQMPSFIEQVILAEKFNKPVIIHCVRAYPDIIAIRKKLRLTIPFIYHGYTGNETITGQLLNHNSYFSFGKHLLTETKLQKIFMSIPIDNIFLETDSANIDIETIYSCAADLLGISLYDLKNRINNNFTTLFY